MVCTVATVKSSEYYENEEQKNKKEKENYYSENNNITARYRGSKCVELGLTGELQDGQFTELIKKYGGKGKWKATDTCFSPPKDYDIIYHGASKELQQQLNNAFNIAIDKAITRIEEDTYRRDNKNNRYYDIKPIFVSFHHDTARMVGNQYPDFKEHEHVISLRKSEKDGKLYSIDNKYLFKYQKKYGAVFRAELAKGLRELGFEIEKENKDTGTKISSFTIKGITKEMRNYYSKRGNAINEVANEKGKTTSIDKYNIAQDYKQVKVLFNKRELYTFWKKDLKDRFNIDSSFVESLRTYKDNTKQYYKNYGELINSSKNRDGFIYEKRLDTKLSEYAQYTGFDDRFLKQRMLFTGLISVSGYEVKINGNLNDVQFLNLLHNVSESAKEIKDIEMSIEHLEKQLYEARQSLDNPKLSIAQRLLIRRKIADLELSIKKMRDRLLDKVKDGERKKSGFTL